METKEARIRATKEALAALGVRTGEELARAIKEAPPIDVTLMVATRAEQRVAS